MTITIVVTKTKLAIAVLAMALFVPATAMAVDSWSDSPDGAFYHDAVTWAKGNGMTVGCDQGTGFCPDRFVTRGENITFAHRYDTLVVQPALTKLAAAQPFATTVFEPGDIELTVSVPVAYATVTVTAPVAGHVTVSSTALAWHSSVDTHAQVRCLIVESTDIPPFGISSDDEGAQYWYPGGTPSSETLSGARTFAIAAGATIDYVLACQEVVDGGALTGRNLTAIFTPAP